ncbi:MAG: STAS domain-containing protein [Flavobacteriales bacterium]|nr:STAS domain-containing protein [Flavobacteriales bacterium]MBL4734796.1 STAS domain-containing protein [Flavobacteriales bacterium]PCH88428.1 MAG: anti-anti-sigma factor [Flavobacteriales bacterium]
MANFSVDKQDRYSVVTPSVDKLDSRVSPELKSELVMINSTGEKNIIVDLRQCKYCDSSGLSAILIGNRLCREVDGSFILSGLQESVQKLISISQLDTVLSITPTLDEAVQMLYMDEIERNIDEDEE